MLMSFRAKYRPGNKGNHKVNPRRMIVPVSAASMGTPIKVSMATEPASNPPRPPGNADNVAAIDAITNVMKAVRKLTLMPIDLMEAQRLPLSSKKIMRLKRLAMISSLGEYNCSFDTDLITSFALARGLILKSHAGNSLSLLDTNHRITNGTAIKITEKTPARMRIMRVISCMYQSASRVVMATRAKAI